MRDTVRRVGQHVVIGFDGLAVSDDASKLVRDFGVGHVILFARNVDRPEQVADLVRELQVVARGAGHDTPIMVSVDQEGGRVARMKDPWTIWPPLRAVGRLEALLLVLHIAARRAEAQQPARREPANGRSSWAWHSSRNWLTTTSMSSWLRTIMSIARMPAPRAVPLPIVKNPDTALNPIDYFINAKLELAGVAPVPPANRRTLLRRAYADLIGLPPSPEEADLYLSDTAPDSYDKLIDRLLTDPRYGERWARHWLDLVRYAETSGHEFDPDLPEAYRYRDYVIRALNADVPYDQFVQEHIAGDLLPNATVEQKVACRSCHLKFLCGGGDLEHSYWASFDGGRSRGSFAGHDPYCELYKGLASDAFGDLAIAWIVTIPREDNRRHSNLRDPIRQVHGRML